MKTITLRVSAVALYIAAIAVGIALETSFPRLLVALLLAVGSVIVNVREPGFHVNSRFVATESVLLAGVLLDLAMTAILSPKADAGLYIGLGLIGLFSWLLTLIGILVVPYGSQSSASSKTVLVGLAVVGLVFLVLLILLFLPATKDTEEDRDSLAKFDTIPGQIIGGGESEFGTPGQCVTLSGTDKNHPVVKSATCGSADSNYRIIKITQRPAGCPTDSDQKFNRWTKEAELTLCLDYDWSPSSCLSIGGATWYATRVPCDRPRSEQPQSVVLDSATVADCPTGGYAHPERRFTICTRLTP